MSDIISRIDRHAPNSNDGYLRGVAIDARNEITALRARLEAVEKDQLEMVRRYDAMTRRVEQSETRAERAEAALATALRDALPDCIKERTFAVQYSPNCPSRWLVRLPGKSGTIDLRPYSKFTPKDKLTGDILGFGKTFEEAAIRALANEAET